MRTFLCLVVAALVVCAVGSPIQSHIFVDNPQYFYGQPLTVHVALFNPSPNPVRVLTWKTPLEGVRHNLFNVQHLETKEYAPYKGMIVKRGEPSDEQFRTFAAGESIEFEFDLAEYYHFLETGMHEITLVMPIVFGEGDALEEVTFTTNSAIVMVEEVNPEALHTQFSREVEGLSFIGCSSSQQNTIKNALSIAKSDCNQAYLYMLTGSCTSDYTTFFGTYSTSRWNTVYLHFDAILSALNSNNFEMDCSTCDMPNTYAYVYPFDTRHRIHFCSVFWTAATGSHQFNSQAGTITHETSHFNNVAGTDDIQYGVAPCKRMANDNPNNCVKNADSHEFFQEMNPKCF